MLHSSMMNRDKIEEAVRRIARVGYSRSGGPGGQNVNKVNTRVTLHVPIVLIGLSVSETERVLIRLSHRVNGDGELVVTASETRSAHRNLERAYARASHLIDHARRPVRPRRPTHPGRAAIERRLRSKSMHAKKKRERRSPNPE